MRKHPWLLAALALLGLTMAGCAEERSGDAPAEAPSAPADTSAQPGAALPDSTEWTVGLLEADPTVEGGPPPVPVLTGLRTGVHPGFERMTLELAGATALPGYRIEYVDRPLHDCGSGEPTYPVGDAWLEVRLYPAAAHTEEGRSTLGARDLAIDQPLLQRIYRTCDFEAVVTHVLALSEPNAFRVMRLADPPRLVVDVRR